MLVLAEAEGEEVPPIYRGDGWPGNGSLFVSVMRIEEHAAEELFMRLRSDPRRRGQQHRPLIRQSPSRRARSQLLRQHVRSEFVNRRLDERQGLFECGHSPNV